MREEQMNKKCNWSETQVTLECPRWNASVRRVPCECHRGRAADLRVIFTKFKRIIQWQTSIRLKLWCSVHQEKFIAEFSRNSNVFGEIFLSENIDTFRCFILLSMLLVELKKVQINYDKELSREGRKKGSNVENYGAVLHALLASALIHWLDYPSISSANSCSSNTVTALDLLGQCPKLRQQCFWSKPSTWHWWL